MSAGHGAVAKELERANEEFKEFERKDIKYREDLKHLKAKLKKLQDKLSKDSAKMQVIAYDQAHSQLVLLPQCSIHRILHLAPSPGRPIAMFSCLYCITSFRELSK